MCSIGIIDALTTELSRRRNDFERRSNMATTKEKAKSRAAEAVGLNDLLAVLYELKNLKEYEENYYREQMEEESRWITISREMALDAGDPSMEGQQWYW